MTATSLLCIFLYGFSISANGEFYIYEFEGTNVSARIHSDSENDLSYVSFFINKSNSSKYEPLSIYISQKKNDLIVLKVPIYNSSANAESQLKSQFFVTDENKKNVEVEIILRSKSNLGLIDVRQFSYEKISKSAELVISEQESMGNNRGCSTVFEK